LGSAASNGLDAIPDGSDRVEGGAFRVARLELREDARVDPEARGASRRFGRGRA
jgi:hypothetical protein